MKFGVEKSIMSLLRGEKPQNRQSNRNTDDRAARSDVSKNKH